MTWFLTDTGLAVLENELIDICKPNVAPTRTGGSGYFWDDFPIIGFPSSKTRGIRIASAISNLLATLSEGKQDTSFEDPDADPLIGNWVSYGGGGATLVHSGDWSKHGNYCVKSTCGTIDYAGMWCDITSITSAGSAYEMSAMIKSLDAETIRIAFYDDVSDWQALDSHAFGANEEGLLTGSATFGGGSTTRRCYVQWTAGSEGSIFYADNLQLISGTAPLPFVEDEAVASICKYAVSDIDFSAGDEFTAVAVCWTPWAGGSSGSKRIWNVSVTPDSTYNRLDCVYDAGTAYLYFIVGDSGGTQYYKRVLLNSTNWAAGEVHIVVMTRESDGTIRGWVDGTEATSSVGTPRKESSINSNLYIGSDIDNSEPLEGVMLFGFFPDRVFTDTEVARISSLQDWLSPTMDRPQRMNGIDIPVISDPLPGIDYLRID